MNAVNVASVQLLPFNNQVNLCVKSHGCQFSEATKNNCVFDKHTIEVFTGGSCRVLRPVRLAHLAVSLYLFSARNNLCVEFEGPSKVRDQGVEGRNGREKCFSDERLLK